MDKLIKLLQEMFGDKEVITEDVENKLKAQFELMVEERVKERESVIKEEYEKKLEEEKETMIENIDKYLSYVAEEWMEENRIEAENEIKVALAEKLIESVKDVFSKFNLKIADEDQTVVAELEEKVKELKEAVNEEMKKAIELKEELETLKKEKMFLEKTADLTESEREELKSLLEGVEFTDEKTYAEKIEILKKRVVSEDEKEDDEEDGEFINEDDHSEETYDIDKFLMV